MSSATRLTTKFAPFLRHVSENGAKSTGRISFNKLQQNNVFEIVIENEQKRNSINGRMFSDFANIIDDILFDSKPLAVIVRGKGDFFCSGADLSLSTGELSTSQQGLEMSAFMTEALNSLRQSETITVASLNGPALGGGAELATAFDFRIMQQNAFIQFVHARIGASPGWGGIARLLSIVGRSQALQLLGTSQRVVADKALQIGLVDSLFDNNNTITSTNAALSFLEPFLQQPYEQSIRGIKRVIGQTTFLQQQQQQELERELFGQRWASEDNKNAIQQFLHNKKK